jgi:uncharacterized protein (DUF305 family)
VQRRPTTATAGDDADAPTRRGAAVRIGAVLVVAALLGTALVGTGVFDRPSRVPDHDGADTTFVVQMVPHHELGVRLIDLAALDASDVRLRELAFEMSGYHGAELAQLRLWRAAWAGRGPGDAGTTDDAGHIDDGPLGMVSDHELDDLAGRVGRDFDTAWLTLMIRHHEGGVTMADAEVAAGQSSAAVRLASTIASVQRDQIAAMLSLLAAFR